MPQAGVRRCAHRDTRLAPGRDAGARSSVTAYYGGHALQLAVIYLMAIDAKLADASDLRRMVRVDDIVADLRHTKSVRILVLDAPRNDPPAEDWRRSVGWAPASLQRGLARTDAPQGLIAAERDPGAPDGRPRGVATIPAALRRRANRLMRCGGSRHGKFPNPK
jgi:hypothetical protein